jgi:hypothetical protein
MLSVTGAGKDEGGRMKDEYSSLPVNIPKTWEDACD